MKNVLPALAITSLTAATVIDDRKSVYMHNHSGCRL